MSGYRDGDESALARNAALKDENDALRAEVEALKQKKAAEPEPKPEPDPNPTGARAFTYTTAAERAVEALIRMGVAALLIVASFWLAFRADVFATMAWSTFISFVAIMGSALAVGAHGYNALFPNAPIHGRHQDMPYVITRSRRARNVYAAVSLALYIASNLLLVYWKTTPW